MLPVIALVGRPNVGKSTLFNKLTASREALVADEPGLTRDRQYGTGKAHDRHFIAIDTGGLSGEKLDIDSLIAGQAMQAVMEADVSLLLVDGRSGISADDEAIARQLRQTGKPVVLVVNKTEHLEKQLAIADFHALGLGQPQAIASAHGHGVKDLLEHVFEEVIPLQVPELASEEIDQTLVKGISIAIAGRPNAGKSTLVNRILGEERVVVFDQAGTTRDSIYIPFVRDGEEYTIIDTAGVRRRARVTEKIEKFSIIKTLQAIDSANVAILILDARVGITDHDMHLLGYIMDTGRALVIAVNKWDGMDTHDKERIKDELHRRLAFIDYADIHFISALHGSGVGNLFDSVLNAYHSAIRSMPTPQLTRVLEDAVIAHQPPLVRGRRIKLRYAHQGGQNPPIIVIHGNQVKSVPAAYKRYLMNCYRKAMKLSGTPVRIEFKSSDNPYKDRKNVLSKRQVDKKKRSMKRMKKKGR
ncbi:MAG: ribosome biogenesis GTPase Der [Gammaproteobacteria bacterium]|nr:MAG: ribosome biogenesis GTPase Der [Gammaproteobacteria bacterium]